MSGDNSTLTGGPDTYSGTAFGDTVDGAGGNDLLQGDDGADSLKGGAGFENTIVGGAGNDTALLADGGVSLDGGSGTDRADFTGSTEDLIVNQDGGFNTAFDKFWQFSNVEQIQGGGGNDTIVIDSALDVNWTIGGGDGSDSLEGNDRCESLSGEGGNDTVYGGQGNDRVLGSDGDTLNGGPGNDTLYLEGWAEGLVAWDDVVAGTYGVWTVTVDGSNKTFTNGSQTFSATLFESINDPASPGVGSGCDPDTPTGGGGDTTCGAFLCEAFSDAFYVCEDCRADESGPDGDTVPGPRRPTPQIPRRAPRGADTLAGLAEPIGADTLPAAFTASPDAIEDLRAAILAGRIGALEQALELARQDARDVEDVEILMLAA